MGVLAALGLPVLAQQQQRVVEFGGTADDRGMSRVAYWDNKKNVGLGEYAISYGRPPWNPQVEAQLDQATIGKIWRLGDNFWTTLDTNLPLKISGVDVPAGNYYLAVERSRQGAWNLALINPAQARKLHMDAYETITRLSQVPVRLRAPLSFAKVEATAQRLSIIVKAIPGAGDKASLTIQWGNLQLKADVQATLPPVD